MPAKAGALREQPDARHEKRTAAEIRRVWTTQEGHHVLHDNGLITQAGMDLQ